MQHYSGKHSLSTEDLLNSEPVKRGALQEIAAVLSEGVTLTVSTGKVGAGCRVFKAVSNKERPQNTQRALPSVATHQVMVAGTIGTF